MVGGGNQGGGNEGVGEVGDEGGGEGGDGDGTGVKGGNDGGFGGGGKCLASSSSMLFNLCNHPPRNAPVEMIIEMDQEHSNITLSSRTRTACTLHDLILNFDGIFVLPKNNCVYILCNPVSSARAHPGMCRERVRTRGGVVNRRDLFELCADSQDQLGQ